jgi:hypothetical protein
MGVLRMLGDAEVTQALTNMIAESVPIRTACRKPTASGEHED